jgi:hypothetical protein
MAVLLGIGLALLLNTASIAGDIKLSSIKTKTDLYEKVTVTGHNDTDIFILHSQGMANVKIKDLDPETLWRVGLGAKPLEPGSPEAIAAAEAKANQNKLPTALAKVLESASIPLPQNPNGEDNMAVAGAAMPPISLQPGPEELKKLLPILIGAAAIVFGLYLFICYCLKLIVQKAGAEPGFLIWLPILQLIPMLRAAGMSLLWFFFWISPLLVAAAMPLLFLRGEPEAIAKGMQTLSLVGAVTSILQLVAALVWCVKIVQARGKSLWVTLFLILPVTNLFAFLYLAFSGSDRDGEIEPSGSEKITIEPVFAES